MSRQAGQYTCEASDLYVVEPDHPDFGTGRLRLPASTWETAGIAYHRPVCCSFKTDSGTWRIYCTSALTTQDRWQKSEPLIDARVVLPAPGLAASQLTAAWLASQQKLSIRPITGAPQNATSVKFKAIGEAQDVFLPALKYRLSQTLFTVGCHIKLAPGCWLQVTSCEPPPTTDPSNTLLRITAATQLFLEGQEVPDTLLAGAVCPPVAILAPSTLSITPEQKIGARSAKGSQEDSTTAAHAEVSRKKDIEQRSSQRASQGTRTGSKSKQDQQNKSFQRLQLEGEQQGSIQSDKTAGDRSGSGSNRKSKPSRATQAAQPSRFDLLDLEGSD